MSEIMQQVEATKYHPQLQRSEYPRIAKVIIKLQKNK